jgi:ATP-dependent DNA helicase RecG
MLDLATEVKFVKGVGPRIAEWLEQKNISTVEDLLYYLPFRYEDRLNPRGIAELRPGEMATVIAEVRNSAVFRTRNGMPIFELVAGQGRSTLKCIWFHGEYLRDRFKPGQLVALYGKVEEGWKSRGLQITQPQFELLDGGGEGELDLESAKDIESLEVGRIVPIYESAANNKLTSRWFRRIIYGALQNLAQQIPDGLPSALCRRLDLLDRRLAFEQVHFPPEGEAFAALQNHATPAHKRLIFEELFFLEVGLELKRRKMRERLGISFALTEPVRQAIKKILPFKPTAAQKRVLGEIAHDMQHPSPMRRLLQGDVGSGKTIVALQAAVIAIENGYQVAFMAPTEILATQHYFSARHILEDVAGYRILLLTGSLDEDMKRSARRHIAQGNVHLVIGTHALIQEKVEFHKLGLVIVDEQHRFGVMQRFKLMKKGDAEPDTLVMTATPIPRTLALTLYGDLDVSVIDELPPGRKPIVTKHVTADHIERIYSFLKKQIDEGRQAYVVYPVIEESETKAMKAAEKMHGHLSREVFPGLAVGLLHGRLPAPEKEAAMENFKLGRIQILVSTTVIEVGVDVPNATVMLIEQAERFGLAQLHQLRGRVGRGAEQSYCILVTERMNDAARERIRTMVDTADGFQIAEMDLKLRGPGEFFGTRQSGLPSLRVANILRDQEILEKARAAAQDFVEHPASSAELERAMAYVHGHWERRYGLVEVG